MRPSSALHRLLLRPSPAVALAAASALASCSGDAGVRGKVPAEPAKQVAPDDATPDAKADAPDIKASAPDVKAPRLVSFEAETTFGYKDESGAVALAATYPMAEDFNEHGIAAVVDGEGWAIINTRGEVLLRPFVFDNGPDAFSEGLARFVKDDKYGFFDERGQVAIEARFAFAEPFAQDAAGRVAAKACDGCKKTKMGEHWRMEGGQWFTVDKTGSKLEDITPPE